MASSYRPRRTCLAVPGSSPRFLAKARGLPADEVFLDLEDAVAPAAKPDARQSVVAALNEGGWGGRIRAVRVNDALSPWAYRDVIEVVEGAGADLDVIVLPKVSEPAQVSWLDLLLGQIEQASGLEPGRIGIEAQIEDARGLGDVDAIAAASGRLEALVFGPADFMASIGMRSLQVCASWSLRAAAGWPRSTARTWLSMTPMGCGGPPPAWPPSVTTGNGCCTPARSTSSTRSSPRTRTATTGPS
jgi:citrate lyase subunit beta/citryl-CoA lyase